MTSAGRRDRRMSLDGESRGCLSLLVAGDHAERPRVFPSPGLSGQISASLVHAQQTVPIHRPRAVLSSPDNDEVRGQQAEKFTLSSALKPSGVRSHDQPAALSPNVPMPLKRVVPKAVLSPADELLYIGEIETSISDEASSCSTSSNRENNTELTPSFSEVMDNILPRILTTEISNEKNTKIDLPPKSRNEWIGREENLTKGVAIKTLAKKHSGLPPTDASHKSSNQQSASPRFAKRSSVRALRPWY